MLTKIKDFMELQYGEQYYHTCPGRVEKSKTQRHENCSN